MEFGATYPFIEKATVHHSLKQLRNSKGKFGIQIKASVQEELPNYLPRYSLADKDYVFPKWKIRYIESQIGNSIAFTKVGLTIGKKK